MNHRSAPTGANLHRRWLELVDTDGPFLAIPVLRRVWPQGMPVPAKDAITALKDAKVAFEKAWENWDKRRDDAAALEFYRQERDTWADVVLRDVLGWRDSYTAATQRDEVRSPDHAVTVRATGALVHGDTIGALVLVVDPVDSLRDPLDDGWANTPIDRLEELLRANAVPIGLVTDGRWWAIVSARKETMVASGIVDAQTWIEEPQTRDAFIELLQRRRLLGGKPEDRLTALFGESVAAAEEITEALGTQVRRAVELLVQALSEAALAADGPDPLPTKRADVYEAAVTVMMRVVFLLFAEERNLLPQSSLFTLGYGISEELDALDARAREEGSEALDATHLTWHRLLATSQALYRGASFEDIRLPSYGGSLFDSGRFPFLAARGPQETLAITVSDRVMLEVLRAVQFAELKGQPARRISFRDIDVEQIGYIYEGLLGYSCAEVDEVTVGLIGKEGDEPEIPLTVLEDLAATEPKLDAFVGALLAWVIEHQPAAGKHLKTRKAALAKAYRDNDKVEDAERALRAVTADADLRDRLRPFVGIIRRDLRNRPLVVLPGGVLLAETPSRATAGAHYTPRSLAEEVVLHALEPLVYDPGPRQQVDGWVLKESWRILDLKVADIACGSGAFLVAAARYLAERLVEAWQREGAAVGTPHEQMTHAIRTVVATCLYGADINGMAVEMCKLSLWLVSLDPKLPFSFVDDKILHGNSLLGLTDVLQLKYQHIDPDLPRQMPFQPDVDSTLQRAVTLRRQLATEVNDADPQRSATTKRRQWREYRELVAELAEIGDAVIATGLQHGGKPGKHLNSAYTNLSWALNLAHNGADRTMLDGILDAGLTPTVRTDYERWKPLHWILMVPDVMERGGFDAIVGNPAFLHSKKITTFYGKNYRDYLKEVLAARVTGDADLAAYFLLRQSSLLSSEGEIGIVVTKSISQSHTKTVGLDQVLSSGASLACASEAFDWGPDGASVSVIKMWITKNNMAIQGKSLVGDPKQPARNLPVRSYVGTYPNGDGFRVSADRAQEWLRQHPELTSRLLPYIRAVDLSQGNPAKPEEYLIDLNGLPEGEARLAGPLWAHLNANQRPWREQPTTKASRERWWDFERSANALYGGLRGLERAIAIPRTSNLLMPRWIPTDTRIDMGVVVFPTVEWSIYAQVASSLHYHWVLSYGATTRDDPSYAPRRLSNTFPWVVTSLHTDAAMQFEVTLEKLCQARGGLRPVMNAFSDANHRSSEIDELRALFVELDLEVLSIFDWADVQPTYDFHERNNLTRFTVDSVSRDELLYRLLEENHRRAQAPAETAVPRPADDRENK
ncbi:Eco57I restriction-modification methylase domain-containing protein [Amycolatopsis magusensis]|uniref:site-specific DNA-methyltransferase (adenine-specific) n=1 Tax=Amycolatopsis magusensis TaxID=882444 RepID=A0ABS4Q5Q8_9PSEU|nr:DNA methyltransferase [Amycolatopsis magusensis]MBP2187023.1 type I restriction-modification system DNA methylase subunit [Amycolatopsis magusensis]